jgi:predicted metal-binding protein
MRLTKLIFAGLLAMSPVLAHAAAGVAPLPQPDPKTKNMSRYQIQLRAFDACLISQSRLQQTTREAVHTPCSCYATSTVKAMTNAEVQAFRDTSVFNDATREKALQQIDRCKLVRPV